MKKDNKDKTEEDSEKWHGITRHMANIIGDFAEFLAVKNDASGNALVASIAPALVEMSFKHAKPGKEDEAMNHTIDAMRLMHQEIVEAEQKEAIAEAGEAKERGHMQ